MATFLLDTFTDTAGDNLVTQHTGETGGTWTRNTASESVNGAISNANRVYPGGAMAASGPFWYASGTPAAADYDITMVIVPKSLLAEQQVAILGRQETAAYTGYEFSYVRSSAFSVPPSWRLGKREAGVFTSLGISAVTLTIDQSYTMKLRMVGDQISAYVDGVLLFSVTDSDITAAGRAGFGFWGSTATWNNTVGIHVDSITAADYVSLGTAALTGTLTGGVAETQIVNGGLVLTITLTDDTWIAS
jgi:hypothetical protein